MYFIERFKTFIQYAIQEGMVMDSEKQNEQQQNQHLQYSKKEKQLLLYIVYDIPLSESTEKLGFEDDIHITIP